MSGETQTNPAEAYVSPEVRQRFSQFLRDRAQEVPSGSPDVTLFKGVDAVNLPGQVWPIRFAKYEVSESQEDAQKDCTLTLTADPNGDITNEQLRLQISMLEEHPQDGDFQGAFVGAEGYDEQGDAFIVPILDALEAARDGNGLHALPPTTLDRPA